MTHRHFFVLLIVVGLLAGGAHLAAQESIVYSFVYGGSDGLYPFAGLVADGAGNFYGTTVYGGSVGSPFNFDGTVYELSPGSGGAWTEKVLYSFGVYSGDGTDPYGPVVFDSKGNLYGTTNGGGAYGQGAVYELSPGSGGVWTEQLIYSFKGGVADGASPRRGGLVFDSKGNLYGTTFNGGANGSSPFDGTVFELSPGSGGTWTEKIIYNFGVNSSDGINPVSGVTFDATGNLYGTTDNGGVYNYGTVYELSPGAGGTWTETVLHSFDVNAVDGANPLAGVIIDSQGNLYGTTQIGGSYGNGNHLGTVYELSHAGGIWTEQILYSFTGNANGTTDGVTPVGNLIFDAAGNLYGTTFAGGVAIASEGTVFELSRAGGTWTERILYAFNSALSDGHSPECSLVFDAAGNLYGTTSAGGSNSAGQYGTVFKLANIVTASPQFSPPGGAYSSGQSVKITDASAGAIIYYSINGGSPTQYTAAISVSSSETISAYALTNGLPQSQPSVANYQIGTVAATPVFTPPAGTYTVAQAVSITDAAPASTIYFTTNGSTPTTSSTKYTSPIAVSASETIKAIAVATGYSESAVGSAAYTITQVTPPQEKLLYSFGAITNDGGVPYSSLIFDTKGNLYGTTEFGGPNDIAYGQKTVSAGTVFELTPGTGAAWTETILYNFGASSTDAALPVAGLTMDSKGNLYGTTFAGGTCGLGTVFELLPASGGKWTEQILHNFGCSLTDGEVPDAPLIFDSKGNLFGTTEAGGAYDTTWGGASNGFGTVFELSPGTGGTWTETVLYSFSYLSQVDGYYPVAPLVLDSKGNLYGTTMDGGVGWDLEGGGSVFELSPAGSAWSEKVLYSFPGGATFGYRLVGGVVLDAAGNIYGTAAAGGNGYGLDGTAFELSPVSGGWKLSVLHSFGAYEGDGINPLSTLVFDAAGNLYGTTNTGGANGYGTVFELVPQSGGGWTEVTLHSFALSSTDGASPYVGLTPDASGNLYGTTGYGGAYGGPVGGTSGGAVYELVTGSTTQGSTTTAVSSSLNPSTYGQPVTFTAAVTASSGTPTGTVTFKNGTSTLGTATLSSGSAKLKSSTLGVGTHSITATYNGSTSYATSTSTVLSQVVSQAGTATTVASGTNPSTYGQSVTYTATVKPQYAGNPAGSVTFKNGTSTMGTATLSGGVATLTVATLGAGTHSVTAVYKGSTSFLSSTSTALSQVVNKATTSTAVTSSLSPSIYGESATFTATVSPQFSGTPSGSVTFKNGTSTVGSSSLSGGVATITVSTLGVGTHSITAVYNGSTSFTTSTSTGLSQVVTKAASTTALISSLNPSTSGQSVTFTATVSPQFTGTPGGSVKFKDGSTTLATVTLSGGVATYTTSSLAKGTHHLTAAYGGSSSFSSSSGTLTQTVN